SLPFSTPCTPTPVSYSLSLHDALPIYKQKNNGKCHFINLPNARSRDDHHDCSNNQKCYDMMPTHHRNGKFSKQILHPVFPAKKKRNNKQINHHYYSKQLAKNEFIDIFSPDLQIMQICFIL